MKRISIFLAASLMVGALMFTSCSKEEETSPMAETMTADDEVAAYFDDILAEADEMTFADAPKSSSLVELSEISGSRTVVTTTSGDTVIHTITFVDFVNPNSPNGRVKNGVIVIKVLGRPILPVFWRQITFVNFTINNNLIEGVKVIEKTAQYQFTITLTNGKITFEDETFYSRDFNRVRTWINGYDTPQLVWDDEFSIEGEAWGVNRRGQQYIHTITSPLLVKRNCRWIVQGIIQFVAGENTAILDYGDGTCDRLATLTVNGESWTITLRGGQN